MNIMYTWSAHLTHTRHFEELSCHCVVSSFSCLCHVAAHDGLGLPLASLSHHFLAATIKMSVLPSNRIDVHTMQMLLPFSKVVLSLLFIRSPVGNV
jgi:hypothetical protein